MGATPGLTREVEKIFVGDNLEVLDSPGVLWPRFDSHVEALKLSAIGAIKETVLPSHGSIIRYFFLPQAMLSLSFGGNISKLN